MPELPPDAIQFSAAFVTDFASLPSGIQTDALLEVERAAKAPDTYGYFLGGNWNSTRWVGVGTDFALSWEPYPLKFLRILKLPDLKPTAPSPAPG
jgi:hypothetical protein